MAQTSKVQTKKKRKREGNIQTKLNRARDSREAFDSNGGRGGGAEFTKTHDETKIPMKLNEIRL